MDVFQSSVVSVIRRLLRDLQPVLENRGSSSEETLEQLAIRLEVLHRQLNRFSTHNHCAYNLTEVLQRLGHIVEAFCQLTSNSTGCSNTYATSTIVRDTPGRPKYDIPRCQLMHLIESGFTCPQISQMIGVSVRTIRRRMSEYHLSISDTYSTLTDLQLDQLVQRILLQFLNYGSSMMAGHLLSQGHRVQQLRIRESLIRVNPEGVSMRWFSSIQRRSYQVYGPMALWHLDGMHKLIRYSLVQYLIP